MIPYMTVFVISVWSFSVAVRMRQRTVRFFLLLFCVALPSLLAGLRNLSVGTDLSVYGIQVWKAAVQSGSFSELCGSVYHIEKAYLFANYLVSRITTDVHVFLFVHQALIMTFVVLLALRLKKRNASEFVLVFYFLYLYNISFNLMRQSFALVIALFASWFVFFAFKKKACAFFGLSCLAHNSAFLGVLILPFEYFVRKYQNKKKMLFMAVSGVGFVVFSFYTLIIYWLITLGLYSSHYEMYIAQTGFKTHKIDLAFLLGVVILLLVLVKRSDRVEPFFSFAFFLPIVAIILNLYGSIVEIAVRVAHYFVLPLAFLLPMVAKSKLTQQKIMYCTMLLLLVHYVYLAFFTGMDCTIPYKSDIIGW